MYIYIHMCVSRVQIPDEHIYIYTQTQCSYIENDRQMPFGTAYIYIYIPH